MKQVVPQVPPLVYSKRVQARRDDSRLAFVHPKQAYFLKFPTMGQMAAVQANKISSLPALGHLIDRIDHHAVLLEHSSGNADKLKSLNLKVS